MAILQPKAAKIILIVSGLFFCSFGRVCAQSTGLNIPSTDVLARREGYIEADFIAHLSSYESGGYQLYGPRIVYGLGKGTEIGLNAFYTHAKPAEPVELQPNFKWKFFEHQETGLAAATGVLSFIPVTQRSSCTLRAQSYAVVSMSFKGDFGPRFTAGGYGLIGSVEEGTTKQGVLLGYDQPISKKLTFLVDWSSGNNDFGYVGVGFGIILPRNSYLYAGYNIGNQGRGNNSIGVYYGVSF